MCSSSHEAAHASLRVGPHNAALADRCPFHSPVCVYSFCARHVGKSARFIGLPLETSCSDAHHSALPTNFEFERSTYDQARLLNVSLYSQRTIKNAKRNMNEQHTFLYSIYLIILLSCKREEGKRKQKWAVETDWSKTRRLDDGFYLC